jgi:hypothetical protein
VLEAFVGPCPEGMQACHNNGNRLDNRLENLRWDTPSANQKDRIHHGTALRGERSHWAKLSTAAVLHVRWLYFHGGYTKTRLARLYGVSWACIHNIIIRRNWGWLKERFRERLAAAPAGE